MKETTQVNVVCVCACVCVRAHACMRVYVDMCVCSLLQVSLLYNYNDSITH